MEIERKWMVSGWPKIDLPLLKEQEMDQGYLTVVPTVRIRREAVVGGETEYVLCMKTGKGLVRREIEIAIEEEKYLEIAEMIGKPLIPKVRRTYLLPDGLKLEANHVDVGQPSEFWYAEVEFPSVEAARAWDPAQFGLEDYLSEDVTETPGYSMGAHWIRTRLSGEETRS